RPGGARRRVLARSGTSKRHEDGDAGSKSAEEPPIRQEHLSVGGQRGGGALTRKAPSILRASAPRIHPASRRPRKRDRRARWWGALPPYFLAAARFFATKSQFRSLSTTTSRNAFRLFRWSM